MLFCARACQRSDQRKLATETPEGVIASALTVPVLSVRGTPKADSRQSRRVLHRTLIPPSFASAALVWSPYLLELQTEERAIRGEVLVRSLCATKREKDRAGSN